MSIPTLWFPNELLIEIAKNLNPVTLKDFIEAYPHLANLMIPILEADLEPYGPVINGYLQLGYRPICWAAMNGYGGLAEIVLEHGADMYATDHGRLTAFHWAAAKGMIPLAEILLNRGFEIDLKDKFHGKTALHFAVENSHVEMARYLVRRGADTSIDWRGKSLVHLAVSSYMNPRPKIPMLQFLVMLGLNIGAQDARGRTALHLTVENHFNESCEVIKFLVEHGVGINFQEKSSGDTALHLAARGDYGVIDQLLKLGANVTIPNRYFDLACLESTGNEFKSKRRSWETVPRNTIFIIQWTRWGESCLKQHIGLL